MEEMKKKNYGILNHRLGLCSLYQVAVEVMCRVK
jgi:hypothetical protein